MILKIRLHNPESNEAVKIIKNIKQNIFSIIVTFRWQNLNLNFRIHEGIS
jgi:hypothetical protein